MMAGITTFQILNFLKQAGLALAGASCLWGIYFHVKHGRSEGKEKKILWEALREMMKPLAAGVLLTVVSWIGFDLFQSFSVLAHEGITITPGVEASKQTLEALKPFFYLFIMIYLAGVLYRKKDEEGFHEKARWFYGAELVLASVMISIPAWTGRLGNEQLFFAGHGFHSILTLGTVLILDFLFLFTKHSHAHERYIYPSFPDISKVIWLGLAIDFASVPFIFNVLENTPKLQFMQTVIGIIIINGVFLAGPAMRKLLDSIKEARVEEISHKWNLALTASGSLSVASWLTVTFVDLMKGLQESYLYLMGLYACFVALTFLFAEYLEHHKVGSRW